MKMVFICAFTIYFCNNVGYIISIQRNWNNDYDSNNG
jgi:hypothetical protein